MLRFLPNLLTLFRMGAGGVLCYFIVCQATISALIVLTIGAISDFYDGYLARKLHVSSESGAFLDPLADKVLVLGGFVGLWWIRMVAWWVVAIIVARDLLITMLRIWLQGRGRPLKTLMLAKAKTVVQFGSLYAFILGASLVRGQWFDLAFSQRFALFQTLHYLSVFVAIITVFTGLIYLPQAMRAVLRGKR